MSLRNRFGVAVLIGLLSGLLCVFALSRIGNGAGDFNWQLRAARDVLAGNDPYGYVPGPYNIPYPLPTAMLYAQWAPLVLCLYFTPTFLPMVLMKPQIALPLAVTQRPNWIGIGLTVAIGLASLAIHPSWPLVWMGQISTYQGTIPPLFVLPLGPLMLLSLLRYRDRKAWLLLLMSAMPQRVLYDQLALPLVANNLREMLILTLCSWISLPVLMAVGGWYHLPVNWTFWILLTLYLPALGVLLAPTITDWAKQWRNLFENRN